MARTYRSKDRTRSPRGQALESLRMLEQREHEQDIAVATTMHWAERLGSIDHARTSRKGN